MEKNSDYNKFTSNTLDAKIAQKRLVNEYYLNEKIKTLAIKEEIKTATKAKLKTVQIVKLQIYDLSLFVGQSYFNNDGAQLYLIFQSLCYTLKRVGNTEKLYHRNLKICQTKNLLLLPLPILVFLYQLTSTEIQDFV